MGVHWTWIVSVISLIVVITTELAYHDPFLTYSLTFIPKIQADASQTKIHAWHTYSDVCLTIASFAPSAVFFLIPT